MYGYIKFMRDHHTISYTAHISSMYWTVQEFFPFIFCFIRELNPILPPYLLPHPRARTQSLYSPLTFSLHPLLPPSKSLRQKHGGKI